MTMAMLSGYSNETANVHESEKYHCYLILLVVVDGGEIAAVEVLAAIVASVLPPELEVHPDVASVGRAGGGSRVRRGSLPPPGPRI